MPMKMKNIITKDIFCASQASTAICSSTDQRSMVRDGIKSLNRLDSKLGDHYKTFTNNVYNYYSSPSKPPCISQLPLTPRPKSHNKLGSKNDVVSRRKSSADVSDLRPYKHTTNTSHSSRYLLGETPFLDSLTSDFDDNNNKGVEIMGRKSFAFERELRKSRSEKGRLGLLLNDENKDKNNNSKKKTTSLAVVKYEDNEKKRELNNTKCNVNDDSRVLKSSSSARARDQVVVLRVSLNCKCRGCESKLRKQISKIEGVTSFSIDLEIKKVTVVGNVTPLVVLTSISKVKNAQFWPSPVSTSSTTSSSSTSSTMDLSY